MKKGGESYLRPFLFHIGRKPVVYGQIPLKRMAPTILEIALT